MEEVGGIPMMKVPMVDHALATAIEPLQRLIRMITVGLEVMKDPTVTVRTIVILRDTGVVEVMMGAARESRGIGANNLRGVTSREGASNPIAVQSKVIIVAAVRDLIKAIGLLLVIVAVERDQAILGDLMAQVEAVKAVVVNGRVNLTGLAEVTEIRKENMGADDTTMMMKFRGLHPFLNKK